MQMESKVWKNVVKEAHNYGIDQLNSYDDWNTPTIYEA